jgi:hypothetical protein
MCEFDYCACLYIHRCGGSLWSEETGLRSTMAAVICVGMRLYVCVSMIIACIGIFTGVRWCICQYVCVCIHIHMHKYTHTHMHSFAEVARGSQELQLHVCLYLHTTNIYTQILCIGAFIFIHVYADVCQELHSTRKLQHTLAFVRICMIYVQTLACRRTCPLTQTISQPKTGTVGPTEAWRGKSTQCKMSRPVLCRM